MSTSETGDKPTTEDKLQRNRKYKSYWGAFLMASCMVFFDKLTGDQYVNLMIFIFGLYMGGNVGEHWTKREK